MSWFAKRTLAELLMHQSEFPKHFQNEYKRLILIASAAVGRSLAEDVVQDAAVIAYRKCEEFKTGSNFGAWIATIVRNCAANERRKSKRAVLSEPQWFDLQENSKENSIPQYDVSDLRGDCVSDVLQLDDHVTNGLRQLSEEARCCLLLRVVEKMSYEDISSYLAIPQGTAMSHVHRSKKLLREFLRGKVEGGEI